MGEALGSAFAAALAAYLAFGGVFAVAFAALLCRRIEPGAAGMGAGVRLLLLPGACLLWPLLLVRVVNGKTGAPATMRRQIAAHRLIWLALAPVLGVAIFASLAVRPDPSRLVNDGLPPMTLGR